MRLFFFFVLIYHFILQRLPPTDRHNESLVLHFEISLVIWMNFSLNFVFALRQNACFHDRFETRSVDAIVLIFLFFFWFRNEAKHMQRKSKTFHFMRNRCHFRLDKRRPHSLFLLKSTENTNVRTYICVQFLVETKWQQGLSLVETIAEWRRSSFVFCYFRCANHQNDVTTCTWYLPSL